MKNILRQLILIVTGYLAFAYFSMPIYGQLPEDDFSSEIYSESIWNIADAFGGKLDRAAILNILANPQKEPTQNPLVLSDELVWIVPEIAVAEFDDTEVVFDFDYQTTSQVPTFELSFPDNPGWIYEDGYTIDDVTKKIRISIYTNPTFYPRITSVILKMTSSDPVVSDTAIILQKPKPLKFIKVWPDYQEMVPDGGTTNPFTVTHFNVTNWIPVKANSNDTWLDPILTTQEEIQFEVDLNANIESRQAKIYIRDVSDETNQDSLIVFQYGSQSSYIIPSPSDILIGPEPTSFDVEVNSNVTWDYWVDPSFFDPDGMILNITRDNNTINFEISENQSGWRSAIIILFSQWAESTEIKIIQTGQSLPYLIISPENSYVGSEGGDVTIIIDSNVEWLADILEAPDNMITLKTSTPTSVTYTISTNIGGNSRIASGLIKSADDPDLFAVFNIIQEASYLFLDPASMLLPSQDSIFGVNVDRYNVETISISKQGSFSDATIENNDSLSIVVQANNQITFRKDTIVVCSSTSQTICDTLYIFQDGAPSSFLLASPREQKIAHTGNEDVDFNITAVNIPDWQIVQGNLPEWINKNLPHQMDTLSLSVDPNLSNSIRSHTILIESTDNTEINDSVTIYQYSGQDHYLLAAPHEQETDYLAEVLNFDITAVNLNEQWLVDILEGDEWIDNIPSGTDLLSLSISTNTTTATRQGEIRIYSDEFTGVADTVYVYQYSGPESLLLASPREQKIAHTGNEDVDFNITAVNIPDWQIVQGNLPEWINKNLPHQINTLSLSVDPNLSNSIRSHTILIESTDNIEINDSVTIYQYSGQDHYLLADPRVQETDFSEDTLYFNVTAVNLSDPWNFEIIQTGNWIEVIDSGTDSLSLRISENNNTNSRQGKVRIFSTEFPEAKDSVYVYQYASPDRYLKASPREQKIAYTGNIDVVFDVTSVNISDWNVDASSLQHWIHLNDSSSPDKFSLLVDPNEGLETRIDTVWIEARGYPGIKDSVLVFQYSGHSPYILMAPREQEISYIGGELPYPFTITSNQVDEWAFTWIDENDLIDTIIRQDNILTVTVDSNAMAEIRYAEIMAFDVNDPLEVYDIVSVLQGSGTDPYIVTQPAAQVHIPSVGDTLTIYTYSNLENYSVERDSSHTWYRFIGDSTFSFNDSLYVEVDTNKSAFTIRASYLTFSSPAGNTLKYFYLQQDSDTIPDPIMVSGHIFIGGDDQNPLSGVSVIIGEDTVVSRPDGEYEKEVPFGWKGTIRPLVYDYVYNPINYVISLPIYIDSVKNDFSAKAIEPTVEFSLIEFTVCAGTELTPSDTSYKNYPLPSISGTVGPTSFKWSSDPTDPSVPSDSTNVLLRPIFKPEVSTKYTLVLYNAGTSDTATFSMNLYPSPVARDFDGPDLVCRNQAGVIYLVSEFDKGEFFSWELPDGGGTFLSEPKSNIAIIDWGDAQGKYSLSLYTYNQFGCSIESTIKTIEVTSMNAPPKTIVKKKQGDNNMLLCSDELANAYEWGWYTLDTVGRLNNMYIIPDKNEWYCRLPHEYNPNAYKYFVITYYEEIECASKSFLNPPVSIDEFSFESIFIYPNPTDGEINIRFTHPDLDPIAVLELYTITGRLIYQQKLSDIKTNSTIVIDETSYLKPGIYFIRMRSESYFYNSKIVIQ